MRTGFSLKEAARVLHIHERRVTQSLDPTLDRIARLWLADASKTMQMILERAESIDRLEQQAFEKSLPHREARLNGGRP